MASIRLALILTLTFLLTACASTQTTEPRSAAEDPRIINQISGNDLLELMLAAGYDADLDDDGDIRWELHRDLAWILVLNEGQLLQFWSYYGAAGVGLADVNEWNKRYYFSKTYIDDDNDIVIEIDLDLKGGTTAGAILEFIYTADLSFDVWLNDLIGLNRMQAQFSKDPLTASHDAQ
ncbi:MAG: YbjN domain-containing protein [Saccharospirillum sp.]|nr:YbjN domain-containing protein [Saccharospirillum sp.]